MAAHEPDRTQRESEGALYTRRCLQLSALDYVSPPWWPDYPPHRKQQIALWGYERTPDLVYGGAAGGGCIPVKTDYLLMAASQFCEEPDYAALIIRKTYQDLSLPGAIMDRAIDWWAGKHGIQWNKQQHRFTWPSGAIVQFGYLQSATDHLRYQGAELQFVGVDEATQIPSNQLTYLHSRLRRRADSEVPMRYRLATNPGGVSHDFVRENYVRGADGRNRVYLPALLHENPGLDQADYRKQLAELDPITRRQLEAGDWDVQHIRRLLRGREDQRWPVAYRVQASACQGLGLGLDTRTAGHRPGLHRGRAHVSRGRGLLRRAHRPRSGRDLPESSALWQRQPRETVLMWQSYQSASLVVAAFCTRGISRPTL